MTRTRTTADTAKSRRRFLKTVALGSAAALVTAALPGSADAARAKRPQRPKPATPAAPAAPARSESVEAEIVKQKQSTAGLLKAIRDYELAPGSEMAFGFAAIKTPKRRAATAPAGGGSR